MGRLEEGDPGKFMKNEKIDSKALEIEKAAVEAEKAQIRKITGARIRELRKEKGLTITELARQLGQGQTTVSQYERGLRIPRKQILEKIAVYFDVDVDYLIGNSDAKKLNIQVLHSQPVTAEEKLLLEKWTKIGDRAKDVVDSILDSAEMREEPTEEIKPSEEAEYDFAADAETFRERLKMLRIQNSFTFQELADELGMAKSTVMHYADGSRFPSVKVQNRMADLFDVDVDFLLGRTNKRKRMDIHGLPKNIELTESGLRFLVRYRSADDTTRKIVEQFVTMESQAAKTK